MTEIFESKTPHFNARKPVLLVIHGIGTSLQDAQNILTGNSPYEASAHYLVTQSGEVRQYVDELQRAWHAGISFWAGIGDINSISIGIELEGKPDITDEKDFYLTHYTMEQMDALVDLVKGICERNKILPANIIAHQDIAPYRKFDPGMNFNWEYFAEKGCGLWHGLQKIENDPVITDHAKIETFKFKLTSYGYDFRAAPEGKDYSDVIRAFQTHFLPWNICGQVTEQSVQALDILLKKKFAA